MVRAPFPRWDVGETVSEGTKRPITSSDNSPLKYLGARSQSVMTAMPESEQCTLAGFGPEANDRFRFTWWNTQVGDAVWIEHRGRWQAGVVAELGHKFVQVAVAGAGERKRRYSKLYRELRRRR